MAFVKIYKNGKALTIPKGAYSKMYAPIGWVLSEEPIQEASKDEAEQDNSFVELEPDSDDSSEDYTEDTDDNEDFSELEEKPLSELSIPELRALAEYKGIDTTGLTSAKKLKDAIKQA